MSFKPNAEAIFGALFLPSPRAAAIFVGLGVAALALALFLRYGIIQNTPIGLACEAGQVSLTCQVRLAVILMFVQDCFGWTAEIAAGVQLWRPNPVAFGVALEFALLGLVLYNTRAAALAVTLLVLSFARRAAVRA